MQERTNASKMTNEQMTCSSAIGEWVSDVVHFNNTHTAALCLKLNILLPETLRVVLVQKSASTNVTSRRIIFERNSTLPAEQTIYLSRDIILHDVAAAQIVVQMSVQAVVYGDVLTNGNCLKKSNDF